MRNQTTFSGFVDVYNVGKEEINGRELYIKRFEEAWFTWKLKCWFWKLDHLGRKLVDEISCFETENIEKLIEIYIAYFDSKFVSDWSKFHDENCSSKNKVSCKDMCKK